MLRKLLANSISMTSVRGRPKLEEVALETEYFIERKLSSERVDFYSGVIYRPSGIRGADVYRLFAIALYRLWIAMREMLQHRVSPDQRLQSNLHRVGTDVTSRAESLSFSGKSGRSARWRSVHFFVDHGAGRVDAMCCMAGVSALRRWRRLARFITHLQWTCSKGRIPGRVGPLSRSWASPRRRRP